MEVGSRELAPLRRRIKNMINRATLTIVDDGATMQSLQVDATKGETLDEVEHWQGYGFTAHPIAGGEALLLSAGGTRAKPVVVSVADRRYRLTGLASGEVAMHDDQGQCIILGRDGARILAKAVDIQGLDGGDCPITLKGDLSIDGNLLVDGDMSVLGGEGEFAMSLTGDVGMTGNFYLTGTFSDD